MYINEGEPLTFNCARMRMRPVVQTITIAATDDDNNGSNGHAVDTVTFMVEGSDDFDVNASTLATSLTSADFEDTPSYSITVIATSTRGAGTDEVKMYAALAVTVKVVDRDDDGTVSFTQRGPQVGKSLAAVLEDDDAGVTNVEWQWYRLTDTYCHHRRRPARPARWKCECPADAVGPVGNTRLFHC